MKKARVFSIAAMAALMVFSACKKDEKKEETPEAQVYGSASYAGKSTDYGKAAAFEINSQNQFYNYDFYAYSNGINIEFDYQVGQGQISSGYSAEGFGGSILSISFGSETNNLNGLTINEDSLQSNFSSNISATLNDFSSEGLMLEADSISLKINSFGSGQVNFDVYFVTETKQVVSANYNGPVTVTQYNND
ncbi:MAG: hypothetical protein ACPF8V_07570 [Luteibaculum sp.]